MSQLRPTFETADELRRKTGLPLLGVVSLALSDLDRRRERQGLVRFGAGAGGLVALFVAGMVAMTLVSRIPT